MKLCCSAPPACLSTPLRPSVPYPSISLVVNIVCIQTFCGHLNVLYILNQADLYRFEAKLELYGVNARLAICLPSFSPSYPPTPTPSRWPARTTLPSIAKFRLVWRRLCQALLSSSSLDGQKHPSLLSRLCPKCQGYKGRFALNVNIKLSFIFADTVDALTATLVV